LEKLKLDTFWDFKNWLPQELIKYKLKKLENIKMSIQKLENFMIKIMRKVTHFSPENKLRLFQDFKK